MPTPNAPTWPPAPAGYANVPAFTSRAETAQGIVESVAETFGVFLRVQTYRGRGQTNYRLLAPIDLDPAIRSRVRDFITGYMMAVADARYRAR